MPIVHVNSYRDTNTHIKLIHLFFKSILKYINLLEYIMYTGNINEASVQIWVHPYNIHRYIPK